MVLPDPEKRSNLQSALDQIKGQLRADGRLFLAIAGPPASGKSTISQDLKDLLGSHGVSSVIVPMDGFHLDNRILDDLGLRTRKGAPETFDLDGFMTLLRRLERGEPDIFIPVFDRSQDLSIAGARRLTADRQVVIIEGNYLLFDEPRWRDLMPFWDLSIWIETPEAVVRERCIARWLEHGHSAQAAQSRAESNDIPNAKRVLEKRLAADITL